MKEMKPMPKKPAKPMPKGKKCPRCGKSPCACKGKGY